MQIEKLFGLVSDVICDPISQPQRLKQQFFKFAMTKFQHFFLHGSKQNNPTITLTKTYLNIEK